ncbi:endonuclease V [Chryseolinea lacunae]|uniref:Endonuclease V n=1 Tax=Chryseolinea lacunae TaxID=2801331 RepID=A0ABS1KW62_9BACT|nr:endonuclease V [Chryseolinea lacunae]MBL0743492.1 endonuclease V [Chryseolinea lacunae]
MKLAIDVYYHNTTAKAVGVLFDDWQAATPTQIISTDVDDVADYEPGNFYKRELPCILKLLEQIDLTTLDVIVVDGYVHLNDDGKAGLGAHLFEALGGKIPVVGVAKTSFHNNTRNVVPVLRSSKNPLFVTAIGTALPAAAASVQNMHGPFRMPTLLKVLDQETRR